MKNFSMLRISVSRHRNFFGGTECCTGPLAGAVDGDFANGIVAAESPLAAQAGVRNS